MTEEMPKPRRPFMRHERNRHGTWCWYVRKGSKRTRLPDEYGTEEFWAAYDAAVAGEPLKVSSAKSGTLKWLVEKYKTGGDFLSLKESSRAARDRFLQQSVKLSGGVMFAKIGRKHIMSAMDDRAKTPHEANNFLTTMRKLFAWAKDHEHVTVNPCDGVTPFKAKIVGHPTWTVDLVEQYRAHHAVGTNARLAIDMLLFTGLRRADLIRVGKQHFKDGVLSIRTGKTGSMVYITVFPELQASIDATPTGDLTLLLAQKGKPFQHPNAFTHWFQKRCEEARIPAGYSAHGLRKAGATIAANAGAPAHELMAMYGWSRISMAEVYTKETNKVRLARGAGERIANAFAPHPEKGAASDIKK